MSKRSLPLIASLAFLGAVSLAKPARSQDESPPPSAPLPNATAYASSTVPRLGATGAPPAPPAPAPPPSASAPTPPPPAPPPMADPPPAAATPAAAEQSPVYDERGRRPHYRYVDRLGWYVPDYVKIQTGGFLGAFQAVVGYAIWKDRFNIGVQYGFTPRHNEAPSVHIFAGTVTVRPFRIDVGPALFAVPIYVGGGVMVAQGKNLFVEQPAVYPAGYYSPTAFQALGVLGLEVGARGREGDYLVRQSMFFELVTINQYIDAFLDNKRARLTDAFSSLVGYRASF